MHEPEKGWGRVYRDDLRILREKGLNSSCAAVYCALVSFCGDKWECWPSISEIMQLSCIRDRDTAAKQINNLVIAGIISKSSTRNADGGQGTNKYCLLLHTGGEEEMPAHSDLPRGENTPDRKNPTGANSGIPTQDTPPVPHPVKPNTIRTVDKNIIKEQSIKESAERKPPRQSRRIDVKPEFHEMRGNTSLALHDADSVRILADMSTPELAECAALVRDYLNTGRRRAGKRANAQLTAGAPVVLRLLREGYVRSDFEACRSRLESGVWQWADVPKILMEVCGQ